MDLDAKQTMKFRPDKQNAYADAFSRLLTPQHEPLGKELPQCVLTMSQVDDTFMSTLRLEDLTRTDVTLL